MSSLVGLDLVETISVIQILDKFAFLLATCKCDWSVLVKLRDGGNILRINELAFSLVVYLDA